MVTSETWLLRGSRSGDFLCQAPRPASWNAFVPWFSKPKPATTGPHLIAPTALRPSLLVSLLPLSFVAAFPPCSGKHCTSEGFLSDAATLPRCSVAPEVAIQPAGPLQLLVPPPAARQVAHYPFCNSVQRVYSPFCIRAAEFPKRRQCCGAISSSPPPSRRCCWECCCCRRAWRGGVRASGAATRGRNARGAAPPALE